MAAGLARPMMGAYSPFELGRTIRIGLDAHMVGGHETGNETYVRGLVQGFSQLDRDFELRVYHVGSPWRPDGGHIRFRRLASANPLFRLAVELPWRTRRDVLEVLHTTYAAPLWSRCPVVVTVHDITFATHPDWFSRRDLRVLSKTVPRSIRLAEKVITVSEVCRAQIIEHYRVPKEKVVCVHNAAGPAAEPISESAARELVTALGLDARRPYILAVGNLQPRKNLIRLIAAFGELVSAGLDVDLVIAGPEHYRAQEVLAEAKKSTRIRFTGYLTDRQLGACYRCAAVFAYLSLFEGFGIPPLEAMAHGVPVVCSNAGALTEVCGAGALYVDPLDVGAIARTLARALTDQQLRSDLARAGRSREQEFSWLRAAERTLDVYEEAARRRALRQPTI